MDYNKKTEIIEAIAWCLENRSQGIGEWPPEDISARDMRRAHLIFDVLYEAGVLKDSDRQIDGLQQ